MSAWAEWPTKKLGPMCTKVGSGITPHGGESVYVTTGTALIRSQNVYNGRFEVEGLAYIGDEHAERMEGVTVSPDDILLNITGDSVARCSQVPDYVLPARVNQHVSIIRPDSAQLNARFLMYFLISPRMQTYMLSLAGSGGTRKALTKAMIEAFEVPSPPLEVQHRIAAILSAYDDLIENNRRRIHLLEQAARLIYQEWFVRLRFPGHERVRVVDGVPEGWERASLSEALLLQRGFDLPAADRREGTVPILASTGIAGTHDSAKVRGPGVVTGRSGSLGVVTFVDEDFWPLNTALWVKEFKRVTPYYAYFMLGEMGLEQYNGGASVPTLDRKAVHRVSVLIPPPTLVEQFDEQVQPIFRQKRRLNQMSTALRSARDLLLPRLMSGEIAV